MGDPRAIPTLLEALDPRNRRRAEVAAGALQILTGHEAEAVAFGTEAPYLQQLGIQPVVLGPGDIEQAHQPDEYLAIDRLQPMIDLLRQTVKSVCT